MLEHWAKQSVQDGFAMCSRSHAAMLVGVVAACALLVTGCAQSGPAANGGAGTSAGQSDPITPGQAQVACHLHDKRLVEISGLAASIAHPGIVWTHNDSGDTARAFAIDTNDCSVRAVVQFGGAKARDVEAIGVGRDALGTPVLWLADIGDNLKSWPNVRLYRIPEPEQLSDQTVPARTFTVRYPDGPHNAEALLVDPAPNGTMWIATKRDAADGGIYQAPASLLEDGSAVLRRIGSDSPLTTDGSYAPNGQSFVLRTYVGATIFTAPPPGSNPQPVAIPLQRQGEAIAFTADSSALLLAGEGSDELWRLPLH